DYPADPARALAKVRSFTLGAKLSVPEVDLWKDIGGYQRVKERIQAEIIEVLKSKDAADEASVKRIESLIPRGLVFWGPPGTRARRPSGSSSGRRGAARRRSSSSMSSTPLRRRGGPTPARGWSTRW